jgi:hypothetical protein
VFPSVCGSNMPFRAASASISFPRLHSGNVTL